MQKDFDRWNENKKEIQERNRPVLFYEREIWWCSLGINIGSEQDGANENFERPVLILKKFNQQVLWVLPITSTKKSNNFFYPIGPKENLSSVILSQIRLISSKRLSRRIKIVAKEDFNKIIKRVIHLFPR